MNLISWWLKPYRLLVITIRRKISSTDDISHRSDLSPMPSKGERVDSIHYYTRELRVMNDRVARMQHDKVELAQKGNDTVRASQWISHQMDRMSNVANQSFVGSYIWMDWRVDSLFYLSLLVLSLTLCCPAIHPFAEAIRRWWWLDYWVYLF